MPVTIVLRAMNRDDLPQVLSIEQSSFASGWSERSFRAELDLPFSRALVAHGAAQPDEVLGYAIRWLIGEEMHILDVAVRADTRRRGIGNALVDTVLAEANASGARVLLEVEASNVAARALYAGRGFVETGMRRGYYGPGRDALTLEQRMIDL